MAACIHGQRWDALETAIRDHASVYYMGSKQCARRVAQALKATAKAAKVRFLLSPEALSTGPN